MTQSRETLRKGSGTMPLQRALSQVGSGKKHANASCSGICPGGCRNHRVVAHGCCARRSTIQGLRYGLQRRCSQVVSPQTAPKRSPRSGWQAMCRCAVGGLHGWADATLPDLAVWADQETPVAWTAMRAGALHDAACIGRPGLGSAVGSVKGGPGAAAGGSAAPTAAGCCKQPCDACAPHAVGVEDIGGPGAHHPNVERGDRPGQCRRRPSPGAATRMSRGPSRVS